jgi:uncharacterized protein
LYSQPTLGVLRTLIGVSAILLILLSQGYWLFRAWRLAGRLKGLVVRNLSRAASVAAFGLVMVLMVYNLNFRGHHMMWRNTRLMALSGLWVSSALFAFLAVQCVDWVAWLLQKARRVMPLFLRRRGFPAHSAPLADGIDPGRRQFARSASVFAGALPFVAAAYGFAIERLDFQVRRVSLPIAGLPPTLEGLRIAQLSDIHIGSYMSAADVRRAVEMANQLRADLTVVTGDFLTRAGDPLEACIGELSRLRAPLGVWGCNGNHEIYADVQELAARLFRAYGMVLLRQQNVELAWKGQPINLIGVDYEHWGGPHGEPMLAAIEPVVRRTMPNILLSHNPNTFPRAAELGIELMLTGHTHGGQVKLEILDHRFSPARFLTPYVAGMYRRPLGASAHLADETAWASAPANELAVVYVNRGLGTIGAPIRLGVPPEISLLTLRRA